MPSMDHAAVGRKRNWSRSCSGEGGQDGEKMDSLQKVIFAVVDDKLCLLDSEKN